MRLKSSWVVDLPGWQSTKTACGGRPYDWPRTGRDVVHSPQRHSISRKQDGPDHSTDLSQRANPTIRSNRQTPTDSWPLGAPESTVPPPTTSLSILVL